MTSDCIFCRIAAGELPCSKVYEDEDTLAIMDIGPVVRGHTLVIPKPHHDPLIETPPEVLQKLITVVQKVAAAQVRGLDAEGINVTQANGSIAGQMVPHIHFHVIPRFREDGHSFNWHPGEYATPEEMETFAAKIRDAIE